MSLSSSASRPGRTGAMLEIAGILRVFSKDMRIEWRNLDNLPSMFFFSLLVLVIFNFGFDFATADFAKIGPGVLWAAFSFAGVLAFGHSFALEREGECMQGLMLAPVDAGSIYLGKMLANLVTLFLVEAAVLPLCAALFNYDILPSLGTLALVVLVHTIGYCAVGTLFGAMTARTRRGDVLLPILLFSISVPLMISAVKTTGAALGAAGSLGDEGRTWMTMACIFDIVFVTAAYLTFDYVIEE